MVRKTKRRTRKTKRQKDFGEIIEQRAKEFAEEVEDLAERFASHAETKGKKLEKKSEKWWFDTLGLLGPLVGSIFSLLVLVFGLWILDNINVSFQNFFISSLIGFLSINMHWFFGAFLLFGYAKYFRRKFPKIYYIISPIIGSIAIYFSMWFSIWVLNLVNSYAQVSVLTKVADLLYVNMLEITVLFLIAGYFFIIFKKVVTNI